MSATQTEPTVFVVDDDQEMRRSFKWLIESVRLPVEVFECAEAFLHAFNPSRPGCLLLDVRMPGMGGLRLLDWLRSQGAHLPVIVLTGHGDVSMAVNALKGGAFHFIEKPANCQQLVHCIQDALALDRDLRGEPVGSGELFFLLVGIPELDGHGAAKGLRLAAARHGPSGEQAAGRGAALAVAGERPALAPEEERRAQREDEY